VNQKRTTELRTLLVGIQRQADSRLARMRQSIAERTGDRRDVGDSCEFVQEEVQAHTAALQADMAHDIGVRVREALRALDRGTYGTCAGCGGEIPVKRLRAQPFATDCVPCREEAEAGTVRPSPPQMLYA